MRRREILCIDVDQALIGVVLMISSHCAYLSTSVVMFYGHESTQVSTIHPFPGQIPTPGIQLPGLPEPDLINGWFERELGALQAGQSTGDYEYPEGKRVRDGILWTFTGD